MAVTSFCLWVLQAKKGGGDHGNKEAEMAESLLLASKPFTDLTTLLTQLVSTDRGKVLISCSQC